jgi:menaquinone-dependent protoporphyrinogen oxidase
MNRVPVFYATTEGQTRHIAQAIASTLRVQGFDSEPIDLASRPASPDWSTIKAAIVGGSIHVKRHQRALEEFVAREAIHLASKPSAFFSVSLSAASRNPEKVDEARALATKFVQNAGWSPQRLTCFAGKLAYTQYGFFTRWLMRRIAKAEGQPTDTSRDYEYTDWTAVREFALAIASDLRGSGRGAAPGDDVIAWKRPGEFPAPSRKVPLSAAAPH